MSDRRPSLVRRWAEASGVVHGVDPDAFDVEHMRGMYAGFSTMFGPGRWFDLHVAGWEHLPDRPSMIVSNHSGGTTALDAFGLAFSWYTDVGFDRPLFGMAHEVVFALPSTGRFFERGGILRADRALGRRLLAEHGRDLLVMPGGDADVWRPARDRFTVRFAGRTGYARTAAEAGAPIVPVAHAGMHHTLYVLTDGRRFAERIRIIRQVARADIWPVHLSLPWGIGFGPWPHLPPPTRMSYRVMPPVEPPPVVTDASVRDFDARVRASMQAGLDQLAAEWAALPRGLRPAGRRLRMARRSVVDLARHVRARRAAVGPPGLEPGTVRV